MKQWLNHLFLSVLFAGISGLCACQKQAEYSPPEPVPFRILNNYFVRNNTPKGELLKVLPTQKHFDEVFGSAAFMGPKGLPTPINFETETVLAVILPTMNQSCTLSVQDVIKEGDKLTFSYTQTMGAPLSYTIRPSLCIAVPKSALISKIIFRPIDPLDP
jgi:hypothetical protein